MNSETTRSLEENGVALARRFGISVREISLHDERAIAELPHAQKRTGHSKKAVFVAQNVVYKGPYGVDDVKLRYNLVHPELVKRLEQWLEVDSVTVIPWNELLLSPRGEAYLVAENLGGTDGGAAWDVVSSKIEREVKVLARGSVVHRVSELEKEPLGVSENVWRLTLQHLYVLFLLGIGDEGSHNVLLGTSGRVIGIDLEELRSRARVPTDAYAALFKRATQLHRSVYARALQSIHTFREQLSGVQLDALHALGAPTSQTQWLQMQISLFQSFLTAGSHNSKA